MTKKVIHCGNYDKGPALCGMEPDDTIFQSYCTKGRDDIILGYRMYAKWVAEGAESFIFCEECRQHPDTALHILAHLDRIQGP